MPSLFSLSLLSLLSLFVKRENSLEAKCRRILMACFMLIEWQTEISVNVWLGEKPLESILFSSPISSLVKHESKNTFGWEKDFSGEKRVLHQTTMYQSVSCERHDFGLFSEQRVSFPFSCVMSVWKEEMEKMMSQLLTCLSPSFTLFSSPSFFWTKRRGVFVWMKRLHLLPLSVLVALSSHPCLDLIISRCNSRRLILCSCHRDNEMEDSRGTCIRMHLVCSGREKESLCYPSV